MAFSDEHSSILLDLARRSIRHGRERDSPLPVNLQEFPEELRAPMGVFVTLHRGATLRGCIGRLEASEAAARAVARHAFNAAYRDPRFGPVRSDELDELRIHISLLSPLEELSFAGEADLLGRIRPGLDGLVLEEGSRRGTFLPSVWEQLPDPVDFLRRLKVKAGLAPEHWSDRIRVWRYTAEDIEDPPELRAPPQGS